MVAIDPLDPQKLVAVWVNNDTKLTTPGAVVTVEAPIPMTGARTGLASLPVIGS